jgi:hypothetical protein
MDGANGNRFTRDIAIAGKTDPWQRMETACIAHTTGLLDWRRANQALFIMPPWHYPDQIKARVIALRDEYERMFVGLIDDLPLRKDVDRRYLRLTLIGALSWSLFWFRKDRDSPATIAKQILSILRTRIEHDKLGRRARSKASSPSNESMMATGLKQWRTAAPGGARRPWRSGRLEPQIRRPRSTFPAFPPRYAMRRRRAAPAPS